MAVVHVTLSRVKGRAVTGVTMPVIDSVPIQAKTATSTATWAEVTAFPVPDLDCFWGITCISAGPVRVFFGASAPTGNDVGYVVPEGSDRQFSPVSTGNKLFIKDV